MIKKNIKIDVNDEQIRFIKQTEKEHNLTVMREIEEEMCF